MTSPQEAALLAPEIAVMARDFSLWLNDTYGPDVSEESVLWRRITKVCEEAGEVRDALGGYVGENPRKDRRPLQDVIDELADCVGAALGAIEHLTGHKGRSLDIATERVRFVCQRVAVRCSSCGQAFSTPPCSRNPEDGSGFHTVYGGVGVAQGASDA